MLQFKPFSGKVLIKKDDVEDKTKNGIVLGVNDKEQCVTGELLSGEQAGERIVFNPGISNTFDLEGEKVTVIFEYDVIAYL